MPSGTFKLTDLYPDITASPRFVPVQSWLRAHEITYDCIPEFQGPMRLMSMLITYNHPIGLYSCEPGCGKSTLMNTLLTNLSHLRLVSTGDRRSFLRDEFFKYNLPLLNVGKVTQGTKFTLWFEDAKDNDLELIRSLIDPHSSVKQQSLNLVLTGHAFHTYPTRFSRHFVPIVIQQSIGSLISSIYSIPIKNWLEEFSADAIAHPLELAHACVLSLEETFDFLRQTFPKIQWNLHHVDAVVNGLLLLEGKAKRAGGKAGKEPTKATPRWSKKKQDEQLAAIVRLFCHELSRVVFDRLVESQGQSLRRVHVLPRISLV